MALLRRRSKRNHAFVPVQKPRARTDDLVIEEFEDEVLIYDSTSKRAHCLGATAASVWRACDGDSDVSALTEALELSAEVVTQALDELEALELLESQGLNVVHSADGNGDANGNGITRRQFSTRSAMVGAGLAAVPLVLSINVTSAVAATATPFVCIFFSSQGLRHEPSGCGTTAGCCCCCQGDSGSCKTCGATAFCNAGPQPSAPVGGGSAPTARSTGNSPGRRPRLLRRLQGAKQCGCGFAAGRWLLRHVEAAARSGAPTATRSQLHPRPRQFADPAFRPPTATQRQACVLRCATTVEPLHDCRSDPPLLRPAP